MLGIEELKDHQLEQVVGGANVVNPDKSQKELEKKDMERDITRLHNLVDRRDASIEDAMKLMNQITGLDNPSIINR